MSNPVEEKKYPTKCIFCGLELDLGKAVRYRGWLSHPDCADKAMADLKDSFSGGKFNLGILGGLLGFVFALPLFLGVVPGYSAYGDLFGFFIVSVYIPTDFVLPVVCYTGVGIALLLQVPGFLGIVKSYDESLGIICGILCVLSSVFYFALIGIILAYVPDPLYTDPITGYILFSDMPSFLLTRFAAFALTAILVGFIAITVAFLEGYLDLVQNRVVAGIMLVLTGFFNMNYIALLGECLLIAWIFFRASIPVKWTEVKSTGSH
jgi:hypothetical protein